MKVFDTSDRGSVQPAGEPNRFSVKITGINQFQNMPSIEIRPYTFLVGPNGSGKSTFIRLLPIFALPERVHLPDLAGRDFSIGHFLSYGEIGNHQQMTDTVSSEETSSAQSKMMQGQLSEFESLGAADTEPQVVVEVEFDLAEDLFRPPPQRLRDLLESIEFGLSSSQTEKEVSRTLNEWKKFVIRRESDSSASHINEAPRTNAITSGAVKVMLRAQYTRTNEWLTRTEIDVHVLQGGDWVEAFITVGNVIFGICIDALERFQLFRPFARLLDPFAQKIEKGHSYILVDLVPDSHSDLHKELVKTIAEIIDDNWGADPDRWYDEEASQLIDSFYSCFLKPVQDFFLEPWMADIARIDSGPLLRIEPDDIGRLLSKYPEPRVLSIFALYWLRKTGIGEELRAENLDGDGWRLQIRKDEVWTNVVNLGGGWARFLWILFILCRLRTASVPDIAESVLSKISRSVNVFRLFLSHYPGVLCVLSNAQFKRPNVVVLEEPENRLHPQLQTVLADMVLGIWDGGSDVAREALSSFDKIWDEEMAPYLQNRPIGLNDVESEPLPEERKQLIGKQRGSPFGGETSDVHAYIVETHSEYLIRRLQSLVAHKRVDPDEIIIHYFSGISNSSEDESDESCWPIEIQEDGTLSRDFGPGFFGEAANLIDDLWQAWKPES